MKPGNKAYSRPDAALLILLCFACLLGWSRGAEPATPVSAAPAAAPVASSTAAAPAAIPAKAVFTAFTPAQPMLHFTQAEILHEAPGSAGPVTEAVSEADLKGAWQPVALPLVLRKADTAGAKPGMHTTWIRVRLTGLENTRGPTRFYLLRWLAAGQLAIYGDGHLLYRSPGTPVWNLFSHPAVLVPLSQGADSAPPKTLLIRLDRILGQNAALSSFYVGEPAAVAAMAERRDFFVTQLPFMTSAAFVLVGIFALGVWIFRRRYPGHLIFAISVLSMLRRWHFQLGIERLPVPDVWFVWLTLNALSWQIIATHFLLRLLHGRRMRALDRPLIVMGVAILILSLPAGLLPLPGLLQARQAAYIVVMLMALTVAVAGTVNAWRARSIDAGLLAGAFGFSYLGGVADYFDILLRTNAESFYFTPHFALVYALICIFIMFRRYLQAMDEIETVNVKLEERVQAREAELAESYERLREVAHKQTLSEERRRLMQDMHDGLGSSLTSALRVVEGGRGSDEELKEVLKSCIDDLKLTIDSMEPVEADLLLLLATLRYRLGPRLKSAGIALRWEVTDTPKLDWLDPRNSLHILRILQEAFGNILKHTQATEIRVATGVDGQWVLVTISDNGPGFDVQEARLRGGRGLANQERRTAELGGQLRVETSEAGTRLTLLLPLQR